MRKGWFKIPGVQDGDRTLDEQLKGLAPLLDRIRAWPAENSGREPAVCELGCAEGLVLQECMKAGAWCGRGFEIVPEAVAEARRQLAGWNCDVAQADLNEYFQWGIDADIVLMLAILHKLSNPFRLVDQVKQHVPELVVVRLPANTPGFVLDARSGNVRFDVVKRFASEYKLDWQEGGHLDEWTGYFWHV